MIHRILQDKILSLSGQFKAVAIMGPRQSGKTTLSRACFPNKPYVSLENPENRRFALEDPKGFLAYYERGAIFDEIQRAPELLSWLQQVLDETSQKGKYILTGSNNFLLLENITQSLAGRVAYVDLLPFSQVELTQIPHAVANLEQLMFKGGYPPIQAEGISPQDWFPAYIRTYVERDVRQIKNIENLLAFERFLSLCAGRVGSLLNYTSLATAVGVDQKTIQSWLGILQASYIIHLLPPYFNNFNKRVVKSPKLYFYDTGLACHLLRIDQPEILIQHPFRGQLFENFIIGELLKNRFNKGVRPRLYFWRDHAGHEIDVILDEGATPQPIEIKSGRTIISDYFKGLRYWAQMTNKTGGMVYYAGDEGQTRSEGTKIRSWRDVDGG